VDIAAVSDIACCCLVHYILYSIHGAYCLLTGCVIWPRWDENIRQRSAAQCTFYGNTWNGLSRYLWWVQINSCFISRCCCYRNN